MAANPELLLLFDLEVLLQGQPRDWQAYQSLGECVIPKPVQRQLSTLAEQGAAEATIEAKAREFLRFLPKSGWQISTAIAPHPALKPAPGSTLSNRARLTQAIAECAYANASSSPHKLVVLVTNQQPLIMKLPELARPNLCGMTQAHLQQWIRSQRVPASIEQHVLDMKTVARATGNPNRPPAHAKPAKAASTPSSTPKRPRHPSDRSRRQNPLSDVPANLLGLVILLTIGVLGWRLVQPQSFGQTWQKLGLPKIPVLVPK